MEGFVRRGVYAGSQVPDRSGECCLLSPVLFLVLVLIPSLFFLLVVKGWFSGRTLSFSKAHASEHVTMLKVLCSRGYLSARYSVESVMPSEREKDNLGRLQMAAVCAGGGSASPSGVLSSVVIGLFAAQPPSCGLASGGRGSERGSVQGKYSLLL